MSVNTIPLIGTASCMAEDSVGNVYVGGSIGLIKFSRNDSLSFFMPETVEHFGAISCMMRAGDSIYFVKRDGYLYSISAIGSINLIEGQVNIGSLNNFRMFAYNGVIYIVYFEDNFLKIRRKTHRDEEVFRYRVPVGTFHRTTGSPLVMRNSVVYVETGTGVYIIDMSSEGIKVNVKSDTNIYGTAIIGKKVFFASQDNPFETFNLCGTDGINVFFIQNKRRSKTVENATEDICMLWKYPDGDTSVSARRSFFNDFKFPVQLLITSNYLYILAENKVFSSVLETFGTKIEIPLAFEELPINEEPVYIIEPMPVPITWKNSFVPREGKNVATPIKAALMPYRTFGPIADVPGKQPNCIPRDRKVRSAFGTEINRYIPGVGIVHVGTTEDPFSRVAATWPPSPV